MTYQPYPKWIYHASGDARVVADAALHQRLGAWWFESPAEAAAAVAVAAAEAIETLVSEDEISADTINAADVVTDIASLPKRQRRKVKEVTVPCQPLGE